MKNYKGRTIYAWRVQISKGEMSIMFADSPTYPAVYYNNDLPINAPEAKKLYEEVKVFVNKITRRFEKFGYEYDKVLQLWVVPGKRISVYGWSGRVNIELHKSGTLITANTGNDSEMANCTREQWNAFFDFADRLAEIEWF